MKTIIKLLMFSTLLLSCHKNCPEPGNYQVYFNGTYEIGGANSTEIGTTTISETTKDSFYIGYSKIYKCGKNIKGELAGIANYVWVELDGKCQKKKGKYYLTGIYKASYSSGNIVNGEFEIKSN